MTLTINWIVEHAWDFTVPVLRVHTFETRENQSPTILPHTLIASVVFPSEVLAFMSCSLSRSGTEIILKLDYLKIRLVFMVPVSANCPISISRLCVQN